MKFDFIIFLCFFFIGLFACVLYEKYYQKAEPLKMKVPKIKVKKLTNAVTNFANKAGGVVVSGVVGVGSGVASGGASLGQSGIGALFKGGNIIGSGVVDVSEKAGEGITDLAEQAIDAFNLNILSDAIKGISNSFKQISNSINSLGQQFEESVTQLEETVNTI